MSLLLLERSDNMWILETNDGDRWSYDETNWKMPGEINISLAAK